LSHHKVNFTMILKVLWAGIYIDAGFKVVFSKDIPSLVNSLIKVDIKKYLEDNNLSIDELKNFVIHPGGTKVINAYVESLSIPRDKLKNTL
jgi:alkylresorcinol/alkylpyrone synthase